MSAKETDEKWTVSNELFNPSTKGAPGTASVFTHLCEECGRDKSAQQVWICTLCIKPYCIEHLSPVAHRCFGANGKPQKTGEVTWNIR
jgi:hypothetical protein